MQGKDTDKKEIKKISTAIKEHSELSVCLLNYKKNGDTFVNQFFVCPVYDNNKKLAYYLGTKGLFTCVFVTSFFYFEKNIFSASISLASNYFILIFQYLFAD